MAKSGTSIPSRTVSLSAWTSREAKPVRTQPHPQHSPDTSMRRHADRRSHLGLRPRRQARHDDSWRYGVLTTLFSTRTSQRLRAHPSLRIPRQSLARLPLGAIPTTAAQYLLHPGRGWTLQSSGGEFFSLALPTLRRGDDRGSEIYRCGIIHMRLLRFFVACPPRAAQGCAPARRLIRVPAASPSSLRPLSAYAFAHLQHHSDNPDGIPTTLRCSPQALFRSTSSFKSHSAPRPPQTPAASS